MKIGELAKRSGLTAYTIRYYEQIGLFPAPDKDASGQRDYDASILTWIEFLGRLKATGMPIREMLRYAALRQQGPAPTPSAAPCLRRIATRCGTMSPTSRPTSSFSTPRYRATPMQKKGSRQT